MLREAQELAKVIDKLVTEYHDCADRRRQEIIRSGCEYRVKLMSREGCPELTDQYRQIVVSLNGHHYYEDD